MCEIKVSIIMPSLNVSNYIEKSLLSALNQTLDEIEIICVDAESTDGTCEIIKKYSEKKEYRAKIRCISTPIKSYGYQVNLGIKEAYGKYIAILETDDYLNHDMYKVLVSYAERYDLDYIKAEFEELTYNEKGEKQIGISKTFWRVSEKYEKIIKPVNVIDVFWYDYNVWRGIYNREFLLKNEIVFNESFGAAYQDIGFNLLTQCAAKRAMYIEKAFYVYQRGRCESSVNSLKGIEYSYYEFKELRRKIDNNEERIPLCPYYIRMATSFWYEFSNYIFKTKETNNLETECYLWFKKELEKALNEGYLTEENLYHIDYDDFLLLLSNVSLFVQTKIK